MTNNKITFDEIFEQNKRRIHYQLHKMNIRDPHQEFFQEGLIAMWNAYEKYKPDKGPMATYFNYMIRNRLIDRMRKENRYTEVREQATQEFSTQLTDGNHRRREGEMAQPLTANSHPQLNDPTPWQHLKSHMTDKQWKWVQFHIIDNLTLPEIAQQENVSLEAVKSWGKQARKKLRTLNEQNIINQDDFF
ncbi:hypothetical protein GCM10028778_18100 [Barrientosiimonas marina]|uniref:Sigma-70 family RNA polymerase sigma factor n=1 Tax=Lentibacillus kimchii TaxID=1542911 RepID=A0ABW2UY41_9BACI